MNLDRAPADAPGPDPFLRRWILAGFISLAVAAVVYGLGVCTRWGQQFGDAAYAGRMTAAPELRSGALDVLDTLRAASVVLIGGGAVLTALVRRRPRLAIVVAAVMGVSILGAEVLKRTLVRPDFGIDPAGMTANWTPSGHTTVAVTLVLGVLMVVPTRLRGTVAIVGALYAAAIASGTLAAGWHRPADAITAALWSFAVAAAGVVVLAWWRGTGVDDADHIERRRLHPIAVSVVVVLPIAVLISSLAVDHDPLVFTGVNGRFVFASIVIDVVAAAVVLVFTRFLRGVELDAPQSGTTTELSGSGGGDAQPVRG